MPSISFFCIKQKTAYEMRISDLSSDVCSSDLILDLAPDHLAVLHREIADVRPPLRRAHLVHRVEFDADIQRAWHPVTDERLAIANRGHAVAGERLLPLRHLDQVVCRRAVKQRAGEFLARRAWGFLRHLIECYAGAARGKGKRE